MAAKKYPLIAVLLTTLVFYLLDGLDLFALRFDPGHLQHWAVYLALALVDVLALREVIRRAQWQGWKRFAALFVLFYAVRYALIAAEAYYLSDLLPPAVARALLVNGALVSAAVTGLGIYFFAPPPGAAEPTRAWHWTGWLWRPVLSGLAYLVLFILSGMVVFRPVALALAPAEAPAYIAAFDNVANPMGVLLFQLLRGTAWALLSVPVLRMMRGARWQKGLVLGLFFGLVMGLKNLVPGELVLGIQAGHTVEVLVENFLFGLVCAGLLAYPLAQPAHPAVRAAGAQPAG